MLDGLGSMKSGGMKALEKVLENGMPTQVSSNLADRRTDGL
jgi:hypothetical protein